MTDTHAHTLMMFTVNGKVDPVEWSPSVYEYHLTGEECREKLSGLFSAVDTHLITNPKEPGWKDGPEFAFKFECHGHKFGDIDVYVFHSHTPDF